MEWIKCSDRLPNKGSRKSDHQLVICFDGLGIFSAWFNFHYELFLDEEYGESMGDITHWMPLPKPPEE